MCGIFGVYNVRKAAELTVIGLHGNQHRAMDYAGIVSDNGSRFYRETGAGLARQVFTGPKLDALHGKDALGHTRYPTVTDDARLDNIQPIVGSYGGVPIAIAHNGNLTNVEELRNLVSASAISTSMDTEYILRLLEARCTGDIEADLSSVCALLRGSFALGILLPNRLIGVRDPTGNRPLSLGRLNGGYCISSETCAFPNLGATHCADVESGTMVVMDTNGVRARRFAPSNEKKCRFEAIYFSHPGSRTFGEEVGNFRLKIGRVLETMFPVPDADIVVPIPDGGNFMALGFAETGRSGKYFPVISRNHYVGRTFIAATQALRNVAVAQKFVFMAGEIRDRVIVVVDDSIVRGSTIPQIVRLLRELGARAVHVRIGSPPIMHPCHYGINTPTGEELIAASRTVPQIQEFIGADSLEFLPLNALRRISPNPGQFCWACMDGEYW